MSKKQSIKPSTAPTKKAVSPVSTKGSKVDLYTILTAAAVLLIAYVRYRLSPMPLERDEGEYAYIGSLILGGDPPYKDAYNMKLPGTYFMYALFMGIFGKSITGVHLGLTLMNAATMILLFAAFKKFFSPLTGFIACTVYGIMSLSYNFLGFAAHATHFVSFYVVLGIYFLVKFNEGKKHLYAALAGLMFGMAFLMKQQSVFFIVFGGIIVLVFYFLNKPINWKQTILGTLSYSGAVFIPYLLTLLLMLGTGVFDKFWFWTVEYASRYAAGVSWEEGKMLFGMTFKPMWEEFMWFWVFALGAFVLMFVGKLPLKKIIFVFALSLFAFLNICPGFYFRQHYFISLLPVVGLLAGLSLDILAKQIAQKTNVKFLGYSTLILFLLLAANAVSKNKDYYFKVDPVRLCRIIYGSNPFTESVEIAKYLKANSAPEDKIAVLGSEPQMFLYADRKSATGYIYTYGLMEIHDYNVKMQEEMIAEIEKNNPKYMVFCRVSTSWLQKPNSPTKIYDWFNKYTQEKYEVVGLADIFTQQQVTKYYWGLEANRKPENEEFLLVFKRKENM